MDIVIHQDKIKFEKANKYQPPSGATIKAKSLLNTKTRCRMEFKREKLCICLLKNNMEGRYAIFNHAVP